METLGSQSLRARVGNILLSPACQKINFSLDGTCVDGSSFAYVALALVSQPAAHGGIRFGKNISPGAEAQYHPSRNMFCFPRENYGQTGWERMTIVHESTHALIDAKRQSTTMLANEMCAFVAGAIYNDLCGAPFTAPPEESVFVEAQKVAGYVTTTSRRWHYEQRFSLGGSDVARLREAVLGHKVYTYLRRHPEASYGENGIDL